MTDDCWKPAPPRKKPNRTEQAAAALLKIKIGAEGGYWLIPEPLRSEGTAKEIIAAVDFDHIRRRAEGGTNAPQNLDPMIRADHQAKTYGKKGDISDIAKGKRFGKAHAEYRRRLLAKDGLAEAPPEPKRKSRKIQSAGFQKGQRPLKGRSSWQKK